MVSVKGSFATSQEIDDAISEQISQDRITKSSFISDLAELVLISPEGEKLKQRALKNNQTLLRELEDSLKLSEILSQKELQTLAATKQTTAEALEELLQLVFEIIPASKLLELSKRSQRPPVYFLIHLISLGLEVYERQFYSFDRALKSIELEAERDP